MYLKCVKALEGAFNQQKALLGAFFMIVKLQSFRLREGLFPALASKPRSSPNTVHLLLHALSTQCGGFSNFIYNTSSGRDLSFAGYKQN